MEGTPRARQVKSPPEHQRSAAHVAPLGPGSGISAAKGTWRQNAHAEHVLSEMSRCPPGHRTSTRVQDHLRMWQRDDRAPPGDELEAALHARRGRNPGGVLPVRGRRAGGRDRRGHRSANGDAGLDVWSIPSEERQRTDETSIPTGEPVNEVDDVFAQCSLPRNSILGISR